MSAVAIGNAITFLIGIPFLFFTNPVFTAKSILFIIILGIFQLGIPYMLFAKASETCPPLTCCLLSAIEPLLNPVWVLLFYGEKPGFFALLGGAVVIGTITLWCVLGDRKKEKEAA